MLAHAATLIYQERVREMSDEFTEEELGPKMAITEDLIRLISEGKARIVGRREGKPVNGRRMIEIDIEEIIE